jgi:hypothetical protein
MFYLMETGVKGVVVDHQAGLLVPLVPGSFYNTTVAWEQLCIFIQLQEPEKVTFEADNPKGQVMPLPGRKFPEGDFPAGAPDSQTVMDSSDALEAGSCLARDWPPGNFRTPLRGRNTATKVKGRSENAESFPTFLMEFFFFFNKSTRLRTPIFTHKHTQREEVREGCRK